MSTSASDAALQRPAPGRTRRTIRRFRTLLPRIRAAAWRLTRLVSIEFAKGFANKAGQLTAVVTILLIVGRPTLDLLLNN